MIRICRTCGKPMIEGMTDLEEFYTHEGECFEKAMDEAFGKHEWMSINDDGCGGYYIYSDETVVGGYLGTGIFYTYWWDDDDELAEFDEAMKEYEN